jgi:mRNA interferase RelE/StbE
VEVAALSQEHLADVGVLRSQEAGHELVRLSPAVSVSPPDAARKGGMAEWLQSGYNLARMRFEILLSPEAVDDFRNLRAHERAQVRDAMERHLRHEPRRESRSRIKKLRGVRRPEFRLRVGDIRVFYDVTESRVDVLAIVTKEGAGKWPEEAARRG